MTYTCSDDYPSLYHSFFVVGGNSAGTESGRIYACIWPKGTGTNYRLMANNSVKLYPWDTSYWTSSTIIAVDDTVTGTNFVSEQWGNSAATDVDGSVLYGGVKIL